MCLIRPKACLLPLSRRCNHSRNAARVASDLQGREPPNQAVMNLIGDLECPTAGCRACMRERLVRDSLGSRWHNFKTSTSRPVDMPLIGLGPELASCISSLFSSSTNSTHWQLGRLYCLLAACDIVVQPTGGHALKWVACERQIRMPRPEKRSWAVGGHLSWAGERSHTRSHCGRSFPRRPRARGQRRRLGE